MSGKRRSTRGDVARVLVALALISTVVIIGASHVAESTAPRSEPVASDARDASDSTMSSDVGTTVEAIGATAHRHHTGSVLLVGDSITVGAKGAGLPVLLRADGWRPDIVAETGQAPRWGIAQVKDYAKVPPLVVVELGTNPSAGIGTFPDDIKVMVAALKARGAQRIVWITPVQRDEGVYDNKVELLRALARTEPTLVVADWGSIAEQHPVWFQADGLHYTEAGYKVLAQYLSDVIDANDPS